MHVDLDCGVISIVVAPDFETSGDVYLGVCFSVRESGVIRARFDRVAGTLDPPVEILRAGHPEATYAWHNVGSIGFEFAHSSSANWIAYNWFPEPGPDAYG